jgi:5-bromo-4-chloroindolyl phosphate hydrolysis protein
VEVHRKLSRTREIKKRSVIPIYGTALIWIIYCLIFPLYTLVHFAILAAVTVVCYMALSAIFPGKTIIEELPEEPVTTGNEAIDAVLREGETAVKELKRLRDSIPNEAVKEKIDILADLTDRIAKDAAEDPQDLPQVQRFMGYFVPTTVKLLNAYDRMYAQGIEGDNISGTKKRVEDILDTTIEAYKKQLDSLFANQALDIETDIEVLERMLKREGLSGKDFK